MMEYIYTYFRDGKEISREKWNKMLDEDIKKENEYSTWNVTGVVYSDIGNGRDVEVNGHNYSSRIDSLYDSAKELFDDLMFEGCHDEILSVLREMNEEEIYNIVSRMECVDIKNDKLLLKDEKDW